MHLHILLSLSLSLLLPSTTVLAHSPANQQAPLSDSTDWAINHMSSEHHISNFDPGAFFLLHDFDSSGSWTADEIRRTYGLDDEESMKGVGEEKKIEVVRTTMERFDEDGDGVVSRGEWMDGWRAGKRLEDFGVSVVFFPSYCGKIEGRRED